MNGMWLASLAFFGLALIVTGWARYAAVKRREALRARGYALISSLKAYSAWVDFQRDEPLVSSDTDELASPEPLACALRIRQAAFPGLSQHMLRLVQAHSRVIEYLWEQNLLRLSQAAAWRPPYLDPQYQQIRGAQEDLIQEIIGLCQEIIGDRSREWRRTGTDFAFSGSPSVTTVPSPTTLA
jgi:hypothetical protein